MTSDPITVPVPGSDRTNAPSPAADAMRAYTGVGLGVTVKDGVAVPGMNRVGVDVSGNGVLDGTGVGVRTTVGDGCAVDVGGGGGT